MGLLDWQQHQGSKGLQTLLDGETGLEYAIKPVAGCAVTQSHYPG